MLDLLKIVFCALLLWLPTAASAQSTRTDMASAILRVKTGERGIVPWRECGVSLRGEDSAARAQEYADYFFTEAESDPEFDPWIGLSIAMQESSLNRCAISRPASIYLHQRLGHIPTQTELTRVLRNPSYRRSMGIASFDAGLVQFRWPGVVASLVGLRDPARLLDAQTSVRMLAASLRQYRTVCSTTQVFRGVHGRTRYSVPCSEGYWVRHNSPRQFNYTYFRNVMRWHRLFTSELTHEEVPQDG